MTIQVYPGVQTAASSKAMFRERRQAIRDTWLPTLAALPDVDHAFVVGTPKNREALDDIHLEEEEHGGPFLILDAEVISPGPGKTQHSLQYSLFCTVGQSNNI